MRFCCESSRTDQRRGSSAANGRSGQSGPSATLVAVEVLYAGAQLRREAIDNVLFLSGSSKWLECVRGLPGTRERRRKGETATDSMRETAPIVDVVIEVPRGSFVKRGSNAQVDFVSPIPCPYNYGSVPTHIGLEGDLLDALVLGPRLPLGATVRVTAWGAVTLTDRGMADDKLICSGKRLTNAEREAVLRFFRFYAMCKGMLNVWRGRSGRNACDGWCTAEFALARARLRDETWRGPAVEF